jgi:hypothetical protein
MNEDFEEFEKDFFPDSRVKPVIFYDSRAVLQTANILVKVKRFFKKFLTVWRAKPEAEAFGEQWKIDLACFLSFNSL